jgi:hypothetical protein
MEILRNQVVVDLRARIRRTCSASKATVSLDTEPCDLDGLVQEKRLANVLDLGDRALQVEGL